MNWREPWKASKRNQAVTFALAAGVGLLLLSPVWITCWERWYALVALEDTMRDQQQMTASLRSQAEQYQRMMPTLNFTRTNPQTLMALAPQSDLQFSRSSQEAHRPTPHVPALPVQFLPMSFDLQSSWSGWLSWLEQWARAAPGVTLSSLTMKANPQGRLDVQMGVIAAQFNGVMDVKPATPLQAVTQKSTGNLMDTGQWAHQKMQQMQSHPSYLKQVMPEMLRVQEPLERYARQQLQYVGQISFVGDVQALIRVREHESAKFSEVHRVHVGSHAGQNFGRVSHIDVDHLVLDELMLDSNGEWQRQQVRMPLQERMP